MTTLTVDDTAEVLRGTLRVAQAAIVTVDDGRQTRGAQIHIERLQRLIDGCLDADPDAPRCFECISPGEDPRPWCDCRDGETCGPRILDPDGCRNRAHEPARCPTPGRW